MSVRWLNSSALLRLAVFSSAVAIAVLAATGERTSADVLMHHQDVGTYDQTVLADQPVAFWDVGAMDFSEPDLTGNGNTGTYYNGLPAVISLPNGDPAADFNQPAQSNQYLSIPSNPDGSLSIPATASGLPDVMTWEAWISPDTLDFDYSIRDGYVDYLGKCETYAPTCEWEGRMYTRTSARPNRLSAYVFNPIAGLGSGGFWQPVDGLFQTNEWFHVVAEYNLESQPVTCQNVSMYPGSIDIWVNGVKWDQAAHGQTGCMSQYMVIPQANTSALNIGTMAYDSWFEGGIAKVAIYKYLLDQDSINRHYTTMTGLAPTGRCAAECTF